SEFVFCKRKGALSAHHIQGDPSSPTFALGTIEHELRRRVTLELRDRYQSLRSAADAEAFRRNGLLDVLLAQSTYVRTLARASHPLYFDQIDTILRGHTEATLLQEEEARLQRFADSIVQGVSPGAAMDCLLPVEVERSLRSSRLGLVGRVDQIWLRSGRLAPVDLKTHGPDLRKFFEESHWVQSALYGLLLEDAGSVVEQVGLHYTYMGAPEFRQLDEELRARALTALRDARNQASRRGIPPVPEGQDKCGLCLHNSKCFGASRIGDSVPDALIPLTALAARPSSASPPEAITFHEWHLRLSRLLRRGSKRSRKDIDRWAKDQRHAILAERGAAEKISVRRMLKSLERLLATRLQGAQAMTHEAYFGGTHVELGPRPGSFYVLQADRAIPWIYVGGAPETGQDVADICFTCQRNTGLSCLDATLIDQDGNISSFPFADRDRLKWASVIVSKAPPKAPPPPSSAARGGEPPSLVLQPPSPAANRQYVGFIAEDQARPLKFGLRGDRVYGFLKEEHRAALAKDDLVIAERVPVTDDGKRIFLRVLEIESAPRSVGTTTKSVSELESQLLLAPLSEQRPGSGEVASVTNDDLTGFQLRVAAPEEVSAFMSLPSTGLPLGRLVASGEPVTVNFPFEPGEDTLFRSFFVVGAKGKGKTSFVREIVTLATTFVGHPTDSRPSVVVLDGEPNRSGDSSEFCLDTLRRAHERLGEQIGGSLLDPPIVREVRITRERSGLAFSYGEIKVEDIVLLLPSLTETSANVLRRILRQMPDASGGGIRNLADVLQHLRAELQSNGQVDGRTARAIAERLMSPQVELFEQPAPDAIGVRELLAPGTVTVLNVVDLADDQRKVVALYLLLAFEKLAEERGGINALLVLDEAEKLFPRARGGQASPTTIQRVAHRVAGIAKRGRRRRFGMVICT
ncbi:MAG TPA: PD-(D/E)XK nuclease family protein, partial [Polyangiaceae bacterium]|nr:PD-(D/E)XK nuclease family protein [Polyangiaceae bacterium]